MPTRIYGAMYQKSCAETRKKKRNEKKQAGALLNAFLRYVKEANAYGVCSGTRLMKKAPNEAKKKRKGTKGEFLPCK